MLAENFLKVLYVPSERAHFRFNLILRDLLRLDTHTCAFNQLQIPAALVLEVMSRLFVCYEGFRNTIIDIVKSFVASFFLVENNFKFVDAAVKFLNCLLMAPSNYPVILLL